MANGKINWFNNSRGFGYITPNDGGVELFVHRSAFGIEGLNSISEGEQVTFDVDEKDPEGRCAINVIQHCLIT